MYALAHALGKSVEEVGRMSYREFMSWPIFFEIQADERAKDPPTDHATEAKGMARQALKGGW